jgi:GIY-YIG catalytic domain
MTSDNYVYALRLECDRYYIGKSKDPEKRYQSHVSGINGAHWTSIYKPIGKCEWYREESMFDELIETLQYMIGYGIYKVRGGPYVLQNLDDETIHHIQRQIWSIQGKCFRCGGDHYIRECKLTEMVEYCCRCGRDHWVSECNEERDIENNLLPAMKERI